MAVKFKDYYETLGVSRTAGDAEIKKNFRKLAREFHPDVAKNKRTAEEKFKEINEAYEVLGDAAKRKKYDELGANWKSGAEFQRPPGAGGRGFEECRRHHEREGRHAADPEAQGGEVDGAGDADHRSASRISSSVGMPWRWKATLPSGPTTTTVRRFMPFCSAPYAFATRSCTSDTIYCNV